MIADTKDMVMPESMHLKVTGMRMVFEDHVWIGSQGRLNNRAIESEICFVVQDSSSEIK